MAIGIVCGKKEIMEHADTNDKKKSERSYIGGGTFSANPASMTSGFSTLTELKNKSSVLSAEKVAVMTALNLCHELLTGESIVNEYNDIEQRIDGLSQKIENTIGAIDKEVLPV